VEELLNEFDARPVNALKQEEDGLPLISQSMQQRPPASAELRKQAVHVGNFPAEAFEAAVESERPPSILFRVVCLG
jgi:hypothetical protein